MKGELIDNLMAYVHTRHPRSARGVEEARAVYPERFNAIANMFLGWLQKARGERGIENSVDAFVQFTTDVNLAQARYEASGRYQHKSFAEVYADHYSQKEAMDDYLWGIFLTNFLWAHHTEISLLYRDRFLSKLPTAAELVEIAPGHGGWGVWALTVLSQARLKGFDISPSAIEIARSICRAAGAGDRAVYLEQNALNLTMLSPASADAVICSFLVEHLEQPSQLFAVISHLLKPKGYAFVTGALTAAQVDHIYEFRYESELVKICEDHGLRVLETLSANPRRTLPKARFLPRSMALIVQKRINDLF
jgi:ubiquinone/menaquinone biosynthesis C-methylase UbiE